MENLSNLLKFVKDNKKLYNNHKTIFTTLANIQRVISTKNATTEDLDFGAKKCENFGKLFPVLFPNENITRKHHVLIWTLPKYLKKGTCYRMMKIEQMGDREYLHCLYNRYENTRKNQKNRAVRFFQCIKVHENSMRNSRRKFDLKLKQYPNGKK